MVNYDAKGAPVNNDSGQWICDRCLYLDSKKEFIVEENDPRQAYLLLAEGAPIHPTVAEKWGLEDANGRVWYPGLPVALKPTPAKAPEDTPTEKEARAKVLEAMKVTELREIATSRGLAFAAVGVKKEEIVQGILGAEFA